ncbi:MAG: polyprenyl synthetase family protein [Candidatus Algichlamydia australiensis]|nr:polyprenyl synthetase family protein [Chlamydiales bacterium]
MKKVFTPLEIIEEALKVSLKDFGDDHRLKEACSYALLSGGKRLRPLLVLQIAESVGKGLVPIDAAVAVEFFHTASLIADDLPCMDNEQWRRGKLALHHAYGETVALLASYGLITAAFEKIHSASEGLSPQVCAIAVKEAAQAAGLKGATTGQFYDLFPPNTNREQLERLHHLKTVTLFETAFIFGHLFGGGDESLVEGVRECARHFGFAFQIADDIADFEEDSEEKNIACFLGKERAEVLFQEELAAFSKAASVLPYDLDALRLWKRDP